MLSHRILACSVLLFVLLSTPYTQADEAPENAGMSRGGEQIAANQSEISGQPGLAGVVLTDADGNLYAIVPLEKRKSPSSSHGLDAASRGDDDDPDDNLDEDEPADEPAETTGGFALASQDDLDEDEAADDPAEIAGAFALAEHSDEDLDEDDPADDPAEIAGAWALASSDDLDEDEPADDPAEIAGAWALMASTRSLDDQVIGSIVKRADGSLHAVLPLEHLNLAVPQANAASLNRLSSSSRYPVPKYDGITDPIPGSDEELEPSEDEVSTKDPTLKALESAARGWLSKNTPIKTPGWIEDLNPIKPIKESESGLAVTLPPYIDSAGNVYEGRSNSSQKARKVARAIPAYPYKSGKQYWVSNYKDRYGRPSPVLVPKKYQKKKKKGNGNLGGGKITVGDTMTRNIYINPNNGQVRRRILRNGLLQSDKIVGYAPMVWHNGVAYYQYQGKTVRANGGGGLQGGGLGGQQQQQQSSGAQIAHGILQIIHGAAQQQP